MPKKNDLVTVEITDLTNEGFGVGKTDSYVLFVPACAVGDVVEVKVLKALASYGYAKVERVLRAAPTRVDPACPAFGKCGGCLFRHISYEAEL
ncbi:MAG: TRAM domain-containing protein, partial [Ruminococcus sp.]|nr:TRAM domain-containing protein [Candidatus Apopatosoma intestinale]